MLYLRNHRGRIRCWWWVDEQDECTGEGWAIWREFAGIQHVPVCYNHAVSPTKTERHAALKGDT